MALLTKKDLEDRGKYSYTWKATPGDNPHIIGKPDSSRLSRKEGYEVLNFINHLADKLGVYRRDLGFKLEDMIHANTLEMREDVTYWIQNNWDAFK